MGGGLEALGLVKVPCHVWIWRRDLGGEEEGHMQTGRSRGDTDSSGSPRTESARDDHSLWTSEEDTASPATCILNPFFPILWPEHQQRWREAPPIALKDYGITAIVRQFSASWCHMQLTSPPTYCLTFGLSKYNIRKKVRLPAHSTMTKQTGVTLGDLANKLAALRRSVLPLWTHWEGFGRFVNSMDMVGDVAKSTSPRRLRRIQA